MTENKHARLNLCVGVGFFLGLASACGVNYISSGQV